MITAHTVPQDVPISHTETSSHAVYAIVHNLA